MSQRRTQRRVTVVLGFVLAGAMALSMIIPLLQPTTQTIQPTATPRPTEIPPPDPATVSFTQDYLHPSGLFRQVLPQDWTVGSASSTTGEALVTLRNDAISSIAEIRIIEPQSAITSPDELSTLFTEQWLEESWSQYSRWQEDTRNVNAQRLVMDFSLSRGRQDFIARQVAFAEGDWVYTVRVVTPENAAEFLRFMLDRLIEHFSPNTAFMGTPLTWAGYYDAADQHLIRFPDHWDVTDAADGAPASISGPVEPGAADEVILRVEADDALISTADEARDWVASWRAGVTPTNVVALGDDSDNEAAHGFDVSYTQQTVDGERYSGLIRLINGADGRLHVADMRFPASAAELSAGALSERYPEALRALRTFTLV